MEHLDGELAGGKALNEDISPEKLIKEDTRPAVVKYAVRNKIMAQKKVMELKQERLALRGKLDMF